MCGTAKKRRLRAETGIRNEFPTAQTQGEAMMKQAYTRFAVVAVLGLVLGGFVTNLARCEQF